MLKQCSQNGFPSRWKNAGFSNGLSQLCLRKTAGISTETTELEGQGEDSHIPRK